MSQTEASSSQQATASSEDDWSNITDPNERRKIQNRIAQRKFREKVRQQREEAERNAENQRRAGAAYTPASPQHVDGGEEGLPWGGLPIRHVLETGREREQNSRESSLYAAASRAGGSSRLGLHLIDNYARGSPAWAAWRSRLSPLFRSQPFLQQPQQQQRAWSDSPG